MIIARNNFIGGLDLDTSLFAFDKSKYIDALNITRDAVQGNQDMVITNIVGNVLVNHTYPSRTIYIGDIGDYKLLVVNNGDGTQTVTITFTPSPSTIEIDLTYNDGTTTVTVALAGLTSPQTATIPNGVYTYGLAVTTNSGTFLVSFSASTITGRSKVIGSYANTLRNTVVFMRWNEYLSHGVYEYDATTNTITKIFENLTDSNNVDILGFTENDKITSIAIYNREEGDLLYFLDSLGRPTVMDITKFKAGAYTPVTRDIINAGKNPSLAPPYYIYGNDTTHRSNGLLNKFFRFIYRYVYDDNTKSSWSPISSVVVPTKILDQTYTNVITNNNLITLSLTSGAKDVKNVELAVSFANKSNEWSDFGLVESISKSANSIADDTAFSYNFYNDGAYPFIDVRDTDALFYYIPDEAKCMILANGNVLVFGGITEGYDRTLTPNVTITINTTAAGGGGGVGNLSANTTSFQLRFTTWEGVVKFIGIPAIGTNVSVTARKISDSTIVTFATYTTVSGDNATSVAAAIGSSLNSIGIVSNVVVSGDTVGFEFNGSTYDTLTTGITPPSSSSSSDSIPTWKWSTTRRIGIVYFDKKGKSNGVLYDAKITFPAYAENGSHQVLLPYINVKIYHQPPDWAYSYQFVITKEPTQYIFWESVSVNTSETDYIYFEVTNFQVNQDRNPTTANVLDYKFQDGDRLRLIRRVSDQTVFADTYDVSIDGLLVEPKINGVTQTGKNFIKVKKVAPLSTVDYSSNNFVIELYRPGQTIASGNLEPFFEFGYQFAINNPTLSTRAHGGNVTNQSTDYVTPAESNLYNGDSYFRLRSIYQTESGVASFYVQDRNIVDFYISAVSSCDGRPSVIDVNAGRQYFGALLRFGQSYEANTNVNGLNVFYADDFQEVDYSLGSVRRLSTRERFLRVFQDYKIGMIPLFSQINKTPNGDVMVQTDKLLNPIQYYTGNFGIGTASESLASYNSADYFADNNRGVYCRVSNDGIIPISILYKVNSWATDNLPKRTGNYKIYGGYDPKSNNYISALEATDSDDAHTLTFDEESNAFESFLSYHPEMIVTLSTLLITFKDGNLYTHNSNNYNQFYGTTYESNISLVFNDNVLFKKTWNGVSQISNVVWDCPLIYSNVNSYGNQRQETSLTTSDFKVLEQMPTASIKRDSNSRGGKINGAIMKGNYLVIKFRKQSATDLIYLAMAEVKYIDSPLTAR